MCHSKNIHFLNLAMILTGCVFGQDTLDEPVLSLKIIVLISQDYCGNWRDTAYESTLAIENHYAVLTPGLVTKGTTTFDRTWKNYMSNGKLFHSMQICVYEIGRGKGENGSPA